MKKLLVVLLAVCLVMMSVVPAFAAESDTATAQSTPDQIAPTPTVSRVEEFYNAFIQLETALQGDDADAFMLAYENFAEISGGIEEFTEDEIEELKALFGIDEMSTALELIAVAIISETVAETITYYDAFVNSPSTSTAVDFVNDYEFIFLDEEYADEELRSTIRRFIPDIDDVYADAKEYTPSEKVYELYSAYTYMMDTIDWYDLYEAEVAAEDFLNIYNSIEDFTEQEKDELAQLMGMSFEDAVADMVSDYITVCVLVETGYIYDDFTWDPNADTAQAYVDQYNAIFNDPSYEDEYLRALVEDFFFDFHELYEDAKAMLEDGGASGSSSQEPQDSPESTKDEESAKTNSATVKTGDYTSYVVTFSLLALAAVASIVLFRKRVK